MSVLDPFRNDVKGFLERHGLRAEEFGRQAAKDPKFCDDLFGGSKGFQSAKLDRVRAWMDERDRSTGRWPPSRHREGVAELDKTLGEYDYDRRIEIYKVMIESAERGIDRRHALNRFYFSVVVAMFVSISFVLRADNDDFPTQIVVAGALLLAFLNSVLWLSMIFAARRLNASKYDVIGELEAELEFAPFTREWQVHVEKRRNFPQFTLIELMLPSALAVICLILFTLVAAGAIFA